MQHQLYNSRHKQDLCGGLSVGHDLQELATAGKPISILTTTTAFFQFCLPSVVSSSSLNDDLQEQITAGKPVFPERTISPTLLNQACWPFGQYSKCDEFTQQFVSATTAPVQLYCDAQELTKRAEDMGINWGLEVINRYESNVCNTGLRVSTVTVQGKRITKHGC